MKQTKGMKNSLKFILVFFLCFLIWPRGIALADEADAEDANLVIVLDSGHDASHAGAQNGDLGEEDLVFKIAQYCKEELEKYAGVTVYMTRDDYNCANGGSSVTSKECNLKRVEFAKSVNADMYVSFHLNSSTSSKANGVGVYYPNQNYKPELSATAKGLATELFDQLTAVGLSKWSEGVLIRNSEDGTTYPDGSLADYLSIIRENKLAGIPAVLIEHAFISNANDVSKFLNSDGKLKTLGIADAKAIINYYNLNYGTEYKFGDAAVACSAGAERSAFAVSASGISDAYSVKFAVWSEKGGQDDLLWYNATKTADGRWVADIPFTNHNTVGEYYIHTYICQYDSSLYKVQESAYNVTTKVSGNVAIENLNTVTGSFDAVISDVTALGGIGKIEVPVWSRPDQSDIIWYEAAAQGDGTYRVHVDAGSHGCNFDNYQVHVYVNTTLGGLQKVTQTSVDLTSPVTVVSGQIDDAATKISLSAWHVPGTFGASMPQVSFAVWNEENGQDDLAWYTAVLSEDSFVATVPVESHKGAGAFVVHAYAKYVNGNNVFVGSTAASLKPATAESIEIVNLNTVTGSFDVVVSGVEASAGVQQVLIPVWSQPDQSDIVWYAPQKQADGTYQIHVDVANHNCNFGTYQVHTYAQNGYGYLEVLGTSSVDVVCPETKTEVSMDEACTEFSLSTWHVPGTFGQSLKNVLFAVWSEKGGQDDLYWYYGNPTEDKFTASIPFSNHNTTGKYQVHVYAEYSNGSLVFIDKETIEVKEASVDKMEVLNANSVTGSFDVRLSGVKAMGGVQLVWVPVWSKADQSDMVWYEAQLQADGTYAFHMDVANHGCNFANYNVHAYVMNGYGELVNVAKTEVDLRTPGAKITAGMNDTYSEIVLDAYHVPGTLGQSLYGVTFAVWSDEGGQDDLQMYAGVLSGDRYIVNIPAQNHTDTGLFHVHVYAHRPTGDKLIETLSFNKPLTSIMGKSKVTVQQMVEYYLSYASYPEYYQGTDAATLEAFCQMYLDECAIEGVRAEVAFCQAMLETGFLKYGGDVQISQHNFAGLGATGNGNPGNSFATVREGIRAQVQHLKAYASSDDLVQECVDTRFSYVRRGTAPYVEWLGIQENPNGTGWAASENYGYILRDGYMLKLMK